jgi:pilus assembly protein CpaF
MPILDNFDKPPGDGDTPQHKDPAFVARSEGGRLFTLDALREQITAQFEAETAGRIDILAEAAAPEARRALLLESVDYVLAVESVRITREEKARLVDAVYADVFSFGPLAPHLNDETITEISINGPGEVHARHGFDKPARMPVRFDDHAHLHALVERQLALHGAQMVDWHYFLEVGVEVGGRPARLSIITPPVTPHLQVELRLHPRQPRTLDALTTSGVLDAETAQAITGHLAERRGLLVVGDVGAGKTTLLGALLDVLPGRVALVQRAAEIRPPEGARALNAFPPGEDAPGRTVDDCVGEALGETPPPDWLVIDEVRDDAAGGAWAALNAAGANNVWCFRGESEPARIRSALNMLLRRAPQAMGLEQAAIDRLIAERLPLAALLAVREGAPRVVGLADFVLDDGELALRPR